MVSPVPVLMTPAGSNIVALTFVPVEPGHGFTEHVIGWPAEGGNIPHIDTPLFTYCDVLHESWFFRDFSPSFIPQQTSFAEEHSGLVPELKVLASI